MKITIEIDEKDNKEEVLNRIKQELEKQIEQKDVSRPIDMGYFVCSDQSVSHISNATLSLQKILNKQYAIFETADEAEQFIVYCRALNKLRLMAKRLNKGKLDCKDTKQDKYSVYYDVDTCEFKISHWFFSNTIGIHYLTEEDCKLAWSLLTEEEKNALRDYGSV